MAFTINNPVTLSATLGSSVPDAGTRRLFHENYIAGYPAEGAVTEAGSYLHQVYRAEAYDIRLVVNDRVGATFCLGGTNGSLFGIIVLNGQWNLSALADVPVYRGQMIMVPAADLVFSCMGSDGFARIVIIQVVTAGENSVPDPLLFSNCPHNIPESVFRVLQSTHFPAPIPLHANLAGVFMSILMSGREPDRQGMPAGDLDLAREAKYYIDQHTHTPVSADLLATEFGLSARRLQKCFRELYGVLLHAYLRNRKLDIAKTQLENSSRTLKQISREAGYRYTSNFSIAYKKKFGISPGKSRRGD
jgi:AraC-like DNA-binding protein